MTTQEIGAKSHKDPPSDSATAAKKDLRALAAEPDGAGKLRSYSAIAGRWSLEIVSVAAILAVFYFADKEIFSRIRLPGRLFFNSSIVFSTLKRPGVLELLLGLMVVPALRFRACSWQKISEPKVRAFVFACSMVVVWAFACYDYNHYYDQAHYLDRLIVVALGVLVLAHPVFLAPLLVFGVAMVRQFQGPIGSFSWTDKVMIFQQLGLAYAYVVVCAVKKPRLGAYLMLALALVGAGYVVPAVGKMDLDWHSANELHNLFIGSYNNGWWANFSRATVLQVADWLKSVNGPVGWMTLAVEFSPLVALFHRRLAALALILCILLHGGIFVLSGIFFWKWIVIDVGLIWVFLTLRKDQAAEIFGWRHAYVWLAVPLMFYGQRWGRIVNLSWYDTELSTHYRMEAIGKSGRRYLLSPGFMSPYDIVFSQNRFSYLSREPAVAVTFAASRNRRFAAALAAAKNADQLTAVERRYRRVHYRSRRARQFDSMMCRYFRSVNKHGKRSWWFGPPRHIWTSHRDGEFAGQEPVERVDVTLIKTAYVNDTELRELARKKVASFSVSERCAARKKSRGKRKKRTPKPRR